jgi:MFS family permease
MNPTKLWTKAFIVTALINFLVALNFYLLMIIISEFALNTLKTTSSEAGLTASIFIIGALLARVFVGKWMMRFGYKKILSVGVTAGLAMTLAYFVANGVMLLLAVRFLHGMTFGITSAATATIVADIIPQERRGEGIGYYSLSQILATAIGPFLGMFLSQHGSYNTIFTACALASFVSLILLPLLALRKKEAHEDPKQETEAFKLSSFIEPKAIPISMICLLIYMCYSSVVSFLNLYAKEIHLADAASFFFVVYAIVVFISRPMIGRMFDLKGENTIMYPAILTFGLGMLLFSHSHSGFVLLLSAVLIGLGFGAIASSTQTIAVKVTPPHRLGLANSTYYMFSDIGMGIGPLAVGFVIPYLGYSGMYTFVGMIALACLALYYFFHGKNLRVMR